MDKTLLDLLNVQVGKELYSANLYLAMANWASQAGYEGAAHWLYIQYQEETAHALHMWEYLLERGEKSFVPAIEKPPEDWKDLEAVFANVVEHERLVTGLIDIIANKAMDLRDHAAYQFILWYVNEQVEEESHAGQLHSKLRLAAGQPAAVLAIDAELGARTFAPPFPRLGL